MKKTERLIISTSRTVHRESCPHISHYVAGHRPVYYQWDEDNLKFHGWQYRIFDDGAIARGGWYKRCSTCVPDIEDWKPRRRTNSKRVSHLGTDDLMRESPELGFLVGINHGIPGTTLAFMSGKKRYDEKFVSEPSDTVIDFYVKEAKESACI